MVTSVVVEPGPSLDGTVRISGAKNSVLKVMAAAVLTPGRFVLNRVPRLTDVELMVELLGALGVRASFAGEGRLVLDVPEELEPVAPYELVEKMRASIAVLGPLVARCGEARVALPGGDDLGPRPIDMHLRGLEALGATVELAGGYVTARAERLVGNKIFLDFPSVGATENVLMAATLAKGVTVIENAAREPEIVDLAMFLNSMGAQVVGAGSPVIEVTGVDELHPCEHSVVSDRIEAATYLAAVGVAGGEVLLEDARADHMDMLIHKLGAMGMRISPTSDGLWAFSRGRLSAVDFATLPYPGIASDYKPMMVAMLATADGVGIVTENVFSGRFRYIDELVRMGADIRTEAHHAIVRGVAQLSGAPVRAHDIRAGAALVVAGLGAHGSTTVNDWHHVDRGYDDLVGKLSALGAHVHHVDPPGATDAASAS